MLGSANVYKYLDTISGGFWNCKKLLTFGRPWNFVTGSRSVGKSTNIACFFVLDYLKNKHKFIYCRRTKDELLLTCGTFFGNAVAIINSKTEFKIHDIEYKSQHYYITYEKDGEAVTEECGCVVPLSLEQKYKSSNFSEYFNLVYDEFICQDSARYLGTKDTPDSEYRAALSLYQTIDRGIDNPYRNETRFFFLGNTATIYNPIFLSLDISDYIDSEAKFIRPKGKLWILERIETVEAMDNVENSFAFMLSDESARDYAYKNKGSDSSEYIRQIPHIRFYVCTFRLNGAEYGVWHDKEYNYYIGKPQEGYRVIALDMKSHKENDLQMITRWTEYPIVNMVVEKYKKGTCFFINGKFKNAFAKYFNLMP